MGKYKPKCDGPFHHGKKSVLTCALSKDLLEKAKKRYPIYDWSSVKKVCWTCKNAIALEPPKRKKSRKGKKNSANNTSLEEASRPSAPPLSQLEGSTASSPAGHPAPLSHRQLAEQANEVHANVMEFDFGPGEAIEIASQESMRSASLTQSTSVESDTGSLASPEYLLEDLNIAMRALRISSITRTTLHRPVDMRASYTRAVARLTASFSKLIQGRFELQPDTDKECEYCDTLFLSMCERYRQAKTKTEKYQILTSLPGKFNATVLSQEAGIKYCNALNAINLRETMGVFSAPPPKVGRKITEEVLAWVSAWYFDDNNSRQSPLMNITIAGPRNARLGRRHMLFNQTEAYDLFKIEHPSSKIKKSKFLQLAPKEVVWPKHHPYHNFCVCAVHANFDFLYQVFGNAPDRKTFVSSILCDPLREDCAYGLCNDCIKMNEVCVLMELLQDEEVTYKQWTRTDGTELKTITVPVEDFSRLFQRSLVEFIKHDYIKNKQSAFIKYLKTEKLKEERALLIVVDFAQNYSVIVQNAVQGHHWSGRQVTVHPFVISWFDRDTQTFKENSYVVISDEMTHDANTFNSFKRKVISHVKIDFETFAPSHIYYVSDNCGGQYKNYKNFAHLMRHEEEFEITAEWVFSGSGHGKGNADRISAIVKSTTRRHALKRDNYILDAQQMFEFCVGKLSSDKMKFLFVSKEEVSAERQIFQQLYATARKIMTFMMTPFHMYIFQKSKTFNKL